MQQQNGPHRQEPEMPIADTTIDIRHIHSLGLATQGGRRSSCGGTWPLIRQRRVPQEKISADESGCVMAMDTPDQRQRSDQPFRSVSKWLARHKL